MTIRLLTGDAAAVLRTLPDRSVQCVVTSPPYFGLRSYLDAAQADKLLEMGGEVGPEAYVTALVAVFQEVRRVLRDDGVAWLNLGDSMNAAGRKGHGTRVGYKQGTNRASAAGADHTRASCGVLKEKDLIMIPARVAIALQADGWYLRSDIIWHKPNPMPESVTDRPTSSHEHIFLLTKHASYYYDAEAVRELDAGTDHSRKIVEPVNRSNGHLTDDRGIRTAEGRNGAGRNLRNVWTIATMPYLKAHFATFPPALVERCIRAGTSERGACPSCGAPWVRTIVKGDPDEAHRSASGSDKSGGYAGRSVKGHESSGVQVAGDVKRRILEGMRLKTYGWRQTCDCPAAPPVPCTVLDPFSGAGTTCLVSSRLGRDAIGIDLNLVYTQMARERIEADAGMFDRVEAPAPPVPAVEKQASLWDIP